MGNKFAIVPRTLRAFNRSSAEIAKDADSLFVCASFVRECGLFDVAMPPKYAFLLLHTYMQVRAGVASARRAHTRFQCAVVKPSDRLLKNICASTVRRSDVSCGARCPSHVAFPTDQCGH